MRNSEVTVVNVSTVAELEVAAEASPYQLVTGEGALGILSKITEPQAEACLRNCTYAHSFGSDAKDVENLLDEISVSLEFYNDDRFFPTVSGLTYDELIWIIISQSYETPRLLALSAKDDFHLEVRSWFERAEAELTEQAAE